MEMILNTPLAKTYGWLRVNGTPVRAAVEHAVDAAASLPAGVTETVTGAAPMPDVKTGAGADTAALLAGIPKHVYRTEAGREIAQPLRLRPVFDRPAAGCELCFILPDETSLRAVVDCTGGLDTAALRITAELGKNARLHLSLVQRLAEGVTFLSDLGGRVDEGGKLTLVRLVLGGETTYDGCSVALAGFAAACEIDAGYRLGGKQKLDMNYEVVHTGKKTACEIRAAGVLSGEAFKLLRGTIDLRRGCAGAVGNEIEDVLLMDETVRNQTVPVILCAEEDVVGNHGATIGRLDEQLIYYLQSRGMERQAIYDMMARARIDAVIRRIGDSETVSALLGEEEQT